ncbi:MAG: hypothetical protein CL980_00175 [Euryarchaeota archaeon]|nr:hypothetical protein [Euryarchaeota archaeon]
MNLKRIASKYHPSLGRGLVLSLPLYVSLLLALKEKNHSIFVVLSELAARLYDVLCVCERLHWMLH